MVVAEIYKFVLTLLVVYYRDFEGLPDSERVSRITALVASSSRASVPAFLYAIQNNLVFIALANLEAATFQIMYQTKIITTAFFSVLLLGRKLTVTETISLLFLFQGVILVQSPPCPSSSSAEAASKSLHQPEMNLFLGFLVVCAISGTSGFAGVFMEKIMKSGSGSPFARNVQLALWGLIFSVIMMLYNDYALIMEKGFFHGYNWVVWAIINISALGGILVALVVSYTDNIAKGFATSCSIVLSSLISIYFFHFSLTRSFFIGACVVILSVILYTDPEKRWAAQRLPVKV